MDLSEEEQEIIISAVGVIRECHPASEVDWGQLVGQLRELAAKFPVSETISFEDLRTANICRLPLFKNKHGEPAHSEADGSDWSDAEWLQAVLGELGEYANVRKKLQRGDFTRDEAQQMMADELADVVTCLDILAFRLDIDLGEAVRDKFNRVSERVGCEVKL